MKKTNEQDFVGQSNSNLDEAIKRAVNQSKITEKQCKVIEMIGRQKKDKKDYQVVLTDSKD